MTGELLLNIPPEPSQTCVPDSDSNYEPNSDPDQKYDSSFGQTKHADDNVPVQVPPAHLIANTAEPDYVNLSSDVYRYESQHSAREMVLNTEWAQIEAIDLVNDNSGYGFGIVGGRNSGVIVKTILAGGISDRVRRVICNVVIREINWLIICRMGVYKWAIIYCRLDKFPCAPWGPSR